MSVSIKLQSHGKLADVTNVNDDAQIKPNASMADQLARQTLEIEQLKSENESMIMR